MSVFGWGDKGRVKRAVEALTVGDAADAARVLGDVAPHLRDRVVIESLRALLFDDDFGRARAIADAAWTLGTDNLDVLHSLDGAFTVLGDPALAADVCERACEINADSAMWPVRLASRLIDDERAREALEVLEVVQLDDASAEYERARALIALDRVDEALPILKRAVAHYERMMRDVLSRDAWQMYSDRLEATNTLYAEAHAQAHGPESLIVDMAQGARLDARSGVNYQLLAESLMVESHHRPERTQLDAPEGMLARLVVTSAPDAATLALHGEALLRLGRVADARGKFEAACAKDGRLFAGFRGLGAALDFDKHDLFKRVSMLDAPPNVPDIERVVPDWSALTRNERVVVAMSVAPLRSLLPHMIEAQMQIVVLPIDVRPTDLDAWSAFSGDRTEDRRALDALGGVASSEERLAAVRVEQLLDIASDDSFIFGHEFAHLAFFCMPDTTAVLDLYSRCAEVDYIAGTYQMSNEHEFFAVAYQDYLRQRYDLPTQREPDDLGIWNNIVLMFDGLEK